MKRHLNKGRKNTEKSGYRPNGIIGVRRLLGQLAVVVWIAFLMSGVLNKLIKPSAEHLDQSFFFFFCLNVHSLIFRTQPTKELTVVAHQEHNQPSVLQEADGLV